MNVKAFHWQQNAKIQKNGHEKFKPENGFCTSQKEISHRGQQMGALDEDPGVGGNKFAIFFGTSFFASFVCQNSNASKQNGLVSKLNPKVG